MSSRYVEALCLECRERRTFEHRLVGSDEDFDIESPPASLTKTAAQGILTNLSLIKQHKNYYGSLSSNNSQTTFSSTSSWDDIPVPIKLRPFVKRLSDFEDMTYQQVCSVLFIIRIADSMLKVAYAAFLTRSFVDESRKKLKVDDLDLEIEIAATRWTYQQGAIMTYHRFASDYDGYAMQELSRIALGVLEDSISVTEGLQRIQVCEERTSTATTTTKASSKNGPSKKAFRGFELFYRQFPGRIALFPLLASFGCVVYFGGTLTDFVACLVIGSVAGIIHFLCSKHSQLVGVEEFLIAITTAMLSTYWTVLFPESSCFRAQVLGSLFCFLHGISFVLSLYEITQNLVITGLTRFCLAALRSFGLGFGVAIGLWFSGYGGPDHFDRITAPCTAPNRMGAVDPFWFPYLYPILGVGALMHLRVSPKHWPICILTQMLGLHSQYMLTVTWKQPMFIGNFIPALLVTITAHVLIVVLNKLHLTKLAVEPTAFLLKKLQRRKDITEPLVTDTTHHVTEQGTPKIPNPVLTATPQSPTVVRFVDHGWADQGAGDTRNGYRRNNRFQYQRSDLWFCLMPSLYLLVPGAAIWRIAFFSIVETSSQEAAVPLTNHLSFPTMISVLFVVGMGQVMGIRLALFILWAFTEIWRKLPSVRGCLGPDEDDDAQ